MNRTIPDELLTQVINYLARRPYHEVYELIPALDGLPKVPEPKRDDGGQA